MSLDYLYFVTVDRFVERFVAIPERVSTERAEFEGPLGVEPCSSADGGTLSAKPSTTAISRENCREPQQKVAGVELIRAMFQFAAACVTGATILTDLPDFWIFAFSEVAYATNTVPVKDPFVVSGWSDAVGFIEPATGRAFATLGEDGICTGGVVFAARDAQNAPTGQLLMLYTQLPNDKACSGAEAYRNLDSYVFVS